MHTQLYSVLMRTTHIHFILNFHFSIFILFSGSPYVRAISPIKAVAGDSFIMHCPFSGYPIEIIRWEKSAQELVSSK